MVHAMSDSLVEQTGAWATHRADVTTRSVEAFLELLETSSPEGVSMPAVARRAGISVRTLYRYFPSRDDLRRTAFGLARARVASRHGRPRARPVEHPAVPPPPVARFRQGAPRRARPAQHPRGPSDARRASAGGACRGGAGATGGDHRDDGAPSWWTSSSPSPRRRCSSSSSTGCSTNPSRRPISSPICSRPSSQQSPAGRPAHRRDER